MQQQGHKYHMTSAKLPQVRFWLVDFVIPIWHILRQPQKGDGGRPIK